MAKKVLKRIDPKNDFFEHSNIRIKFHGGDGHSVCSPIVSAFLSLALNLPIPAGIAMTGQLSDDDEMLLRVGGIRDKVGCY